jgi:TrmH family RNA methyltransferase
MSFKLISSRDNPFFRILHKLSSSARQRQLLHQTLLDGPHLVGAYLASGRMPQHLIVTKQAMQDGEIASMVQASPHIPVSQLDEKLFAELSELKTPNGLLALIDIPKLEFKQELNNFCVMLENIQDPGNLGSILRTAAAAGCDAAFLSKGCADVWSPKVLRAGMGGHFELSIFDHADLIDIAGNFNGTIFGTSLQARESLYQNDYTGNVAFAFGNEGAGLSQELVDALHHVIVIPMSGQVESLNAAAAAAVCLYEAVRQRHCKATTNPGCAQQAKRVEPSAIRAQTSR